MERAKTIVAKKTMNTPSITMDTEEKRGNTSGNTTQTASLKTEHIPAVRWPPYSASPHEY